jgi:hypothetical protein
MDALLRAVLITAICLIPCAIAVWVIRKQRQARLSCRVAPFQELRRRPLGESLQIKLGELDENADQRITMLVAVPNGAEFRRISLYQSDLAISERRNRVAATRKPHPGNAEG